LKVWKRELIVGKHEIEFDGRNLASGMYIYLLNVKDKFLELRKCCYSNKLKVQSNIVLHNNKLFNNGG